MGKHSWVIYCANSVSERSATKTDPTYILAQLHNCAVSLFALLSGFHFSLPRRELFNSIEKSSIEWNERHFCGLPSDYYGLGRFKVCLFRVAAVKSTCEKSEKGGLWHGNVQLVDKRRKCGMQAMRMD